MLTQQNIIDKGFTYWRSSAESVTNERPDRDDYLAIGVKHKDAKNEYERVLLLSYDSDGYLTITTYFNNPVIYREYYVNYVQVTTTAELDEVIDGTDFTIEEIDLTKLTTDYE